MLDDARLRLGAVPVPGFNPAGDNARYDPAFEALEAEVSKMDTLGLAGVDWSTVGATSLSIIETKSKDLLVGSYATLALYRTESYPGLAIGLTVLADMAETYWDGLMPPLKRERARVQALEWLAERVGPAVAEDRPQNDMAEAVIAAHQAIERLSDTLDARLQKSEASLGVLLRPLRDYARDAQRTQEAQAARLVAEQTAATAQAQVVAASAADASPGPEREAPAAVVPAGAVAAGVAQTAPAVPVVPPSDAAAARAAPPPPLATAASPPAPGAGAAEMTKSLRALRSTMLDFAAALRSSDISDPRAYALTRTASALMMQKMPETRDGRLVDMPPPNADDVLVLEAAMTAGDTDRVISLGESLAANAPLWLTLHRIVAERLDTLGPNYVAAREAVAGGALALASRFDGLADLAFSDGTPTADDRTRSWLREIGGGGGGGDMESPIEQSLREARTLASQGELSRAGALLAEAHGVSGRADALEWQIARARFCLEVKDPNGAISILEAVEAALSAPHVAVEWDSALVVRATALQLRAYESLPHGEDDGPRAARIAALRSRLYALDLGVAMNVMRPQ